MKKYLLLLILIVEPFLTTFAQKNIDYERFAQKAGKFSTLYRGHIPLIYNFKATGTYYAYKEDFEKGIVKYNGRIYTDVLLNLNSNLDELQVMIPDTKFSVVVDNNFVDYFSFDGRNYVNVKEDSDLGQSLLPGYYQVLWDGRVKLFKKVKKLFTEKIDQSSTGQYSNKLERLFVPAITYYMLKDGNCAVIKRRSDIIACFKEYKKGIRKISRENNLDFRNDKDRSFTEVFKYVESGMKN